MEDSKIVSLVNKLISSNVEKIINSVLRRKYLLSRKAVIVNDYNSVNDTASIIIPSDPNMATNYFYPNKTGHTLVVGAKMYLVYQTTNISQGWLEDNKSMGDLANKKYVDDNIKSQIKASELQPLLDNQQYRPCVRITGYVDVLGSATTGKSDVQQIKEWIIKVTQYYGAHIMIDVLLQADVLYRLTGYMYREASYGAIVTASPWSITHYYRRDFQWFDG